MSYRYGQFTFDHLHKVKRGIVLYNTRKYWECHEELEDHWQAATALFHYEDQNLAGAHGMITKAKEKVKQCMLKKVETDLVYKFLGWKKFTSLIMSIPEKPQLKDFEKLHQFKFSNPEKWGAHIGESK